MIEIRQYDIWRLKEGLGGRGGALHPLYCLVLSPLEMNANIATVIIAPMTRLSHGYPTRIPTKLEAEDWWILLDQLVTVRKASLLRQHSMLIATEVRKVKAALLEMLIH